MTQMTATQKNMTNDELLRKIIEIAVASGRQLQSPETQLIHYHPQAIEGPAQSIPLYENMLFCLALMRTKTHEAIIEAKGLLDRLLYFQQLDESLPNYGSFPVHLHDYPVCYDHFLSVRLLPVLFWMQKDFSCVFGEVLQKRVSKAYEKLVLFLNSLDARMELPYWVRLKIGMATTIVEEMNPTIIGEVLSACQMHALPLPEPFLQYLSATWHNATKCYVGPQVKLQQAGFEPACTLYDYYLGYLSGALPARALKPQVTALQAALIHPWHCELLPISDLAGSNWMVHKEKEWAVSLMAQAREANSGFYPFFFAIANHTLVLDIPKGQLLEFKYTEDHQVELILEIGEESFSDNIEKAVACSFFIDDTKGIDFIIASVKASAFSLNDPVQLQMNGAKIQLQWELLEGEGIFMGHLNKGNRPSQLLDSGKNRYSAFDLQLFLRAVRGKSKCRLKVLLSITHE